MGLKSGSRDAGLDETDEDDEQSPGNESTDLDSPTEETDQFEHEPATPESDIEPTATANPPSEADQTEQRPTMNSIPYKLRRNKVNEGREQVPYFLRDEIIDAEDELQETLEEILGEDVYKSDYREAAMVVAQRQPELVAEVLREWGYDLETT